MARQCYLSTAGLLPGHRLACLKRRPPTTTTQTCRSILKLWLLTSKSALMMWQSPRPSPHVQTRRHGQWRSNRGHTFPALLETGDSVQRSSLTQSLEKLSMALLWLTANISTAFSDFLFLFEWTIIQPITRRVISWTHFLWASNLPLLLRFYSFRSFALWPSGVK